MSVEILSQLKSEFDDAQKFLKVVDENIKRLTGRDPAELRTPARRSYGGPEFRARDRPFPQFESPGDAQGTARRGRGPNIPRVGLSQRRPREEADEDSPDEDPPRKVTVQSSVVATLKAVKTRKDTIETQKGDRRGMERNKRMFGMILGTLQKFQSEESKRKEQAQKRAEIEQKLEQAAEEEREKLRKERQDLFLARREKQAQIRRLEQKLEIAQMHEEWEASQKMLLHFILTSTCSRPIAYRPKRHTPESQKKLHESRKKIEESIEKQRKIIEEQLDEIDELYRKGGLEETFEEMEDECSTETSKSVDKENVGPPVSDTDTTKEDDVMSSVEPVPIEIGVPSLSETELSQKDEGIELPAENKPVDSIGDQEFEPIYD